jgi:acyl-CoA thioesterase FadM
VGAGDIDLNQHLNNAVYARFIEDVLEKLQPGASQRLSELQINFQHAGQLNDVVGCSGTLEGNKFTIHGGSFFCACGTLA